MKHQNYQCLIKGKVYNEGKFLDKMDSKMYRTIVAGIIVLGVAVLLAFSLWPFLSAFVGAFALYVLFKPFYNLLVRKWKWRKSLAATFIIVLSFVIITIPLLVVFRVAYSQVYDLVVERNLVTEALGFLDRFFPEFDLQSFFSEHFSTIGNYLSGLLFDVLTGLADFVIVLVIMYFTLYYLLVEERLREKVEDILPFSKKNTQKLLESFRNITYTTVVATALISAVQGLVLGVGFYFLGIERAALWGVIAGIISFIPLLGTPVVWVPAMIIKGFQGEYGIMIGILIVGVISSSIDNFIRPPLQRRIGQIHPLTTIVGVFIGLKMFGLIGIIVGPLLLSYAILLLKIFREEYLS